MISVLIVDDEVLALKFLQNLINWQEEGFIIIGVANSGEKALQLFSKHNPQLVISDIRMPHRDGLFLCEQIRTRGSDAKIILLSAFQDFTYAKQAIKYGVSNYILKHELNAQTLLSELEKIKKEIFSKSKIQKILNEKLISNFILSSNSSSLEEPHFATDGKFTLLMIKKDVPYDIAATYTNPLDTGSDLLSELIIVSPQDETDYLEFIADTPIDNNHHVVLFSERTLFNGSQRHEAVLSAINDYRSNIINGMFSISAIFIGNLIWSQIPSKFRQLAHCIRYSIFYGPNYFGPQKSMPIDFVDKELDVNKVISEIEKVLYDGTKEIECKINKAFEYISKPMWNLSGLRKLCAGMAELYKSNADRCGVTIALDIGKCYRIEQLEDSFIKALTDIGSLMREYIGYTTTIRRAVAYIRMHYADDLTLEDLGDLLGLNGTYLGQLFRKETGTTFLKYLTAVRLEYAKELLLDGRYNVSEVADIVGYKTSQYFGHIFLKNVGMTPHQFRMKGIAPNCSNNLEKA